MSTNFLSLSVQLAKTFCFAQKFNWHNVFTEKNKIIIIKSFQIEEQEYYFFGKFNLQKRKTFVTFRSLSWHRNQTIPQHTERSFQEYIWGHLLFHPHINIYGRLIECLKGTTSNQMRKNEPINKIWIVTIFSVVSNTLVILKFMFFCSFSYCLGNQHSQCVHTGLFIYQCLYISIAFHLLCYVEQKVKWKRRPKDIRFLGKILSSFLFFWLSCLIKRKILMLVHFITYSFCMFKGIR